MTTAADGTYSFEVTNTVIERTAAAGHGLLALLTAVQAEQAGGFGIFGVLCPNFIEIFAAEFALGEAAQDVWRHWHRGQGLHQIGIFSG